MRVTFSAIPRLEDMISGCFLAVTTDALDMNPSLCAQVVFRGFYSLLIGNTSADVLVQ